jgi:guanine deaminase
MSAISRRRIIPLITIVSANGNAPAPAWFTFPSLIRQRINEFAMTSQAHEGGDSSAQWMDEAVSLGRIGLAKNGGPFGAVVISAGKIIGRGFNQVTPLLDPTAHAEVLAIREACQSLGRFDLRGCTLYTSCEPCPMCLAAIYWARLDKVYYACTRHDAAAIGFDDNFIYEQLPLEIADRSLPMEQISQVKSLELFREWAAKPDKVIY